MAQIWAMLWAVLLLALPIPTAAQNVITLVSVGGDFEVSGTFLGFDGRFLRLETGFGELTVDSGKVNCLGEACPGISDFVPELRVTQDLSLSPRLLPALLQAFSRQMGMDIDQQTEPDGRSVYILRRGDAPALRVTLAMRAVSEGFADILADDADLLLSMREIRSPERQLIRSVGYGDLMEIRRSRVLALDALVPIRAPSNPLQTITAQDLARVFAGEITNWAELGGPDRDIALHLPVADGGLGQVIEDRLMRPAGLRLSNKIIRYSDMKSLMNAVANDPDGIGIKTFLKDGRAAPMTLAGPCGFTSPATRRGIKSEDYPLTIPLILYHPTRRLPEAARDFVEFLHMAPAQLVIRRIGYVDQIPETIGIDAQGRRFTNAIMAAGRETTLEELQRMAGRLAPMQRLSTSFRFEPGSTRLDAQSRSNVRQLGRALQSGKYAGRSLVFIGFSDGEGAARANREISLRRAEIVRAAVREAAQSDPARSAALEVDAFGEALPMACDDTEWGRQTNRRVETWLR